MEFGVLGPLQVRAGGEFVDVRRGHPRTLLVALLLSPGEAVHADTLMELLWGDQQPQHPANALQVQISYLRKVLASAEEGSAPRIETRPAGYALVADHDEIDLRRFDRLVREAAEARDDDSPALAESLELIDAALALWRGPALADVVGEPFALSEITRLDEARWAAIETRNDLLLGLGRHREVVGELTSTVKEQPLRERFHEQLILALYRSGRQADALRAYETARSVLLDELGLDPGGGLQQLERQVLEQSAALDWEPLATDATSHPSGPGATVWPTPLTGLVGRAVELSRADELLTRHRLVTFTGPGGAGKSRLAVEVATQRHRDGDVWFVDLGSVSDSGRVAATIAAGIGVPSTPSEDTSVAISDALARAEGLLVLDTCEHVLEAVAEIVIRILQHCPDVHVLATSRRPLGITGEIAWPVPPLASPPEAHVSAAEVGTYPAVALFVERATSVRPDFVITDENAAEVASICEGLDGLPLAIELAAARADVFTPAAINARIQNRFDFLVDGGREAAERQQTLRSAIAWSVDLLSDEQRCFFTRLSVFPGSFDLDAAVLVAGTELPDPLTVLSALVRSSMVSNAGDDRYRLLDTLRAYALDVLGGPDAATRKLHGQHYTVVAEESERHIIGPDQLTWLARVRADVPNFRAGFEWCIANDEPALAARLAGALSWFWTLDGMLAEAVEYLERVAPIGAIPPLVRSKALSGLALLAASLGRMDQALTAARESLDLARTTGDVFVHGFALNVVAVVEWARGDLEASAAAHDQAIELVEGTDNAWLLGVCLALRARTALDLGDPDGEHLAEAALIPARASGDRHVIGLALLQIAELRLARGDVSAAVDAATECLTLQDEIAYTEGTVAALHVLARSVHAAGDADRAGQLNVRALALADRIGHIGAVCEALEGLARIADEHGDHREACRLLDAADAERRTRHLPARARDRTELDALRTRTHDSLDASGAQTNIHGGRDSIATVLDSLLAPT